MSDWQLKTPVVFIIFKRPDTTEKVFEVIRQAKPPKLLVIADGARADKPGEAEKCAAARAIIDRVDWDCEVLTNYSDVNLGCAKRVSSGLDWVFDNVEEAIILEDDCIPHPTFFRFCEELLERYQNDDRIMVIAGNNFQFGHRKIDYSYYFSRYNHCWGWASWRRAWQHFDFTMKVWPEVRDNNLLRDILLDASAVKYWKKIFQSTYRGEGKIDSWAFRWTFTCWVQSGLTILPNVNLITNIGYAKDATHTTKSNQFDMMAVEAINFPLQHPPFVIRDVKADDFTQKNNFRLPSPLSLVKKKVKELIKY
ncbi:glycosyltransferase family 2 protein [Limnofasciculus baicalensis]|uniref:Glycosyltransferase family 2 protein n=1 Tax=Limnofasciculus baicalensis BBK-W-15 TaxID=2699891 RepID=A0AAE3GR13_9CYAN|nr:glycosyltransferase family 2 protein [Limnofasciculus baicalensis]MCP2728634.1 glycosyltransferase family 2 protein [Limnofasciculus baicalensis BBK-W-15]